MNDGLVWRDFFVGTVLFISLPGISIAQRSAGDSSNIDPIYLIDTPIAGVIPTTAGSIEAHLYPHGGILVSLVYGLQKNLNLGVSFGGTGIIGSGGIDWNHLPGVHVRYRLMEESFLRPAIVVGLDTQGRDGYIADWKQYVVKSPGIFVTISKNYRYYGLLSFHGGMNYTLERYDEDFSPNLFFGAEKSIGSLVSVLVEYNFAFDNDKGQRGFWNGSLNVGARISTNIGFNVDFHFKNLLTSDFYYRHVTRTMRIQYVRYL